MQLFVIRYVEHVQPRHFVVTFRVDWTDEERTLIASFGLVPFKHFFDKPRDYGAPSPSGGFGSVGLLLEGEICVARLSSLAEAQQFGAAVHSVCLYALDYLAQARAFQTDDWEVATFTFDDAERARERGELPPLADQSRAVYNL